MGDSTVMKSGALSHDWARTVRSAIRLLLLVVLLGWLLLWIMMPTNEYKQIWLPKLRTQTNSTYFGRQGTTLLFYTVPILFIASLGCVYLHLGKRNGDYIQSGNGRRSIWRIPVVLKGSLGIVYAIELAFFVMFLALLIWCISADLQNTLSRIMAIQFKEDRGEAVWVKKIDMAGLIIGLVGNICFAFLFFPVTRGSSILALLGLTSEASIRYHIWIGHIAMTILSAHGLCFIIGWTTTHRSSKLLEWNNVGISNVAGELALLCGLVMWATSLPRVRRKMFELFFYTHHLYVFFLLFFALHVGISFFCTILPGVYLFMIDRYLRFLQSRRKIRLVSARLLPCEMVELNFSKSPRLNYTPTSSVFINIPSISTLQWHPFTVSSNSNMEQEQLSVIIKCEGSWSQKLYKTLSSPSSVDRLDVSIEGPYGPTSTHFLRHDTLVMVSGGSGIAPFISIIRELIYISSTCNLPTPKVHLICAFKYSIDLTVLDLLLPLTNTPSHISPLKFQLEAFVTRESEPTTAKNTQKLRTIWFKPNPSDVPISQLLGPNSWLWVGAIISTSFVAFLILLGIITRYYIYPIDHNTNTIFSSSLRSMLNTLLICVCIAATASAAVLWNKKQNDVEMKQIPNMQEPIATDRELESLPQQSLTEAAKVHYGARPDLKKLLTECEGSSIGVLVCGPTTMRHEVAAICSSRWADNLHFECISFSW